MFTVTARGVYGLSALVELAFSYERGSRQIKDIAKTHNIPPHYLEQILVLLKKAGVVESFRGAQGGYALSRQPSQIRLLEVLRLLEGELNVLPDQRQDNSLSFFWNAVEDTIRKFLDRSLEDLMLEMQGQITYSI